MFYFQKFIYEADIVSKIIITQLFTIQISFLFEKNVTKYVTKRFLDNKDNKNNKILKINNYRYNYI